MSYLSSEVPHSMRWIKWSEIAVAVVEMEKDIGKWDESDKDPIYKACLSAKGKFSPVM